MEALWSIIKTLNLALVVGGISARADGICSKSKTQLDWKAKARYQRKQVYLYVKLDLSAILR